MRMTSLTGVAALVRAYDWSRTSFGAADDWPDTMRALVQQVLDQPLPMTICWGRELSCLYNDAAGAMLGNKHPAALGAPGREAWGELWPVFEPLIDGVLRGGPPTYQEDLALPMRRHGLLEEAYFSVGCSPLAGPGSAIVGVLLSCQETSAAVHDARALLTLRGLCTAAVEATTPDYACAAAMRVLGDNRDLPFALVYLVDGEVARVAAMHGLGGLPAALTSLPVNDEAWPFAAVAATGEGQVITSLPMPVPKVLGQSTYGAMVSPLILRQHLQGFLVTGISPVRPLDAHHLAFHRQLAQPLVLVIASGETEQRRRLQATEVEQAHLQADNAVRVKDEFLAMLGHELRNPLAPILTALELMRLRGNGESQRERTIIERQVRHLVLLVDDLLDVSRLLRGKIVLTRARVELGEVIDRALELSRPLAESRQHVVIDTVPRSGLAVNADLIRLTQVFTNLLNNAARYTPPGGRITISAVRDGTDVVVTVADNGVGIAAEMLGKVFHHFTQGHQTIARSGGGLGLGLAIVRSLMLLHNGTIEVRSDGTGAGSEFIVRLPMAAAAEEPALAMPPVVAPKTTGLKVLVVDDNIDLAELLSEALTELGYVTRMAHDGATALAAVEDFRPDVALLDIGLPVMDGYELARRLRALPDLGSLRLVALSGYGQDSDRQLAKQAGFDAHLVKPVDLNRLAVVIDG